MLTADGESAEAPPAEARRLRGDQPLQVTVREVGGSKDNGPLVQVQRLANPLVNELIIGTVDKDEWNSLDPKTSRSSSATT